MEALIDHTNGGDNQDFDQELPADEAEPVMLSRQVLASSEAAMHDKILVGKVLTVKKLNKLGVRSYLVDEEGNFGAFLPLTTHK